MDDIYVKPPHFEQLTFYRNNSYNIITAILIFYMIFDILLSIESKWI